MVLTLSSVRKGMLTSSQCCLLDATAGNGLQWLAVVQVLEVSAGTGRNIGYYSTDVESVVFSDVSYDMLRKAKLQWEAQPRTYKATFVLSDIEALTRVCCFPIQLRCNSMLQLAKAFAVSLLFCQVDTITTTPWPWA
jgi:hypothetical protein